jgi:hypothetical protein
VNVVERGQRAAQILSDPVFEEAVGRLRARVTQEWEGALTTEQREIAWYRLHALASICQELAADASNAVFEIAQAEQREKLAQREKPKTP